MTTNSQDESRYDPITIPPRPCPLAVRVVSTGMITLGICQGLLLWLGSGSPVQNDRVAVVNTVLFFSAFTHLIAGIYLRGLSSFARWVALINIGADAGMILLGVYLVITETFPVRSPYVLSIRLNPDLYYLLAVWLLLLMVFAAWFFILTHPKTVEAFKEA